MSRDGEARTVFESSLELMAIIATIIQERKLFKGGNYQLLGFLSATTIQGRKQFAELRNINHQRLKG